MSCTTKLSVSILRDCDEPNVAGIEQEILLISVDDLLASGITKDVTTPNSLLTDIACESGTQGYKIDGIKQIIRYTNSFVTSEDSLNGVKHMIEGIRIYDQSQEARDQINRLIAGGRFFAVLERKWKGVDDDDAFLFFGIEHGLELLDLSDASNENDGCTVISLGTPEGFKEPYLPHVLLETDYDTTKAAFDLFFATA